MSIASVMIFFIVRIPLLSCTVFPGGAELIADWGEIENGLCLVTKIMLCSN